LRFDVRVGTQRARSGQHVSESHVYLWGNATRRGIASLRLADTVVPYDRA
jgi:hypothetical protein